MLALSLFAIALAVLITIASKNSEKCKRCGEIQIFKKLNYKGLCAECSEIEEKEEQHKQEREKAEKEQRIKESIRLAGMSYQQESTTKQAEKAVLSVLLSPEDLTFDEAVEIYFSTDHLSCPQKYNYSNYFKSAFECILNNIPEHEIQLSDEKVLRNNEIDNPIENYKRITKANKISKLKNFIAIDTETTGLHPGGNDIIEICAIKFIDFKPTEKFHTYLKPRKSIPPDATKVNHITDEMVENAPVFSQIKNDLQNFIKGFPLVAHNAPFDMEFLHVSGLCLDKHKNIVFDTLRLSRAKIRDYDNEKLYSYSLRAVCEQQNIALSGAHSADADALACGILFVDIIKLVFEADDISELLLEEYLK